MSLRLQPTPHRARLVQLKRARYILSLLGLLGFCYLVLSIQQTPLPTCVKGIPCDGKASVPTFTGVGKHRRFAGVTLHYCVPHTRSFVAYWHIKHATDVGFLRAFVFLQISLLCLAGFLLYQRKERFRLPR